MKNVAFVWNRRLPVVMCLLLSCAQCQPAKWDHFSTSAKTLTVFADQELIVNAPFFGIEVRKNGKDITDDIVNIESLSDSSWKYTFGTEVMDVSNDVIEFSLENEALASPGHYITVREGSQVANTVQSMYALLLDCETGHGLCEGRPALPGLLEAVRGMSRRYAPRDIETSEGVYDFSAVFADAAFLKSKGMRLHVMFAVKSFAADSLFDGDGLRFAFPAPQLWLEDSTRRDREVHVYVNLVDTPFSFDSTRTQVLLALAPPVGIQNINVVYARDPFPEYTWNLRPPIAGWYTGVGGPHTNGVPGNSGFVHAPWRSTCVQWMKNLVGAFQAQWTAALASSAVPAGAIESVSIQETANALGGEDYTEEAYRAGLLEYSKANARAVRRRALHGQLFNQIPGGKTEALTELATAIIPWGARLEGPDLFNNEISLETKVYQVVHRDLSSKALTMIWHQNASYGEPNGLGGYYSPAEQFEKAKLGIDDTHTASGTPGIEAEYVFWNMTQKPSGAPGYGWQDALPVIAANPAIQAKGNDTYLWKKAADGSPLESQALSQTNP